MAVQESLHRHRALARPLQPQQLECAVTAGHRAGIVEQGAGRPLTGDRFGRQQLDAFATQLEEGARPGVEGAHGTVDRGGRLRSEEHTSELQSLMRISYAVFCLKKKT